MDYCVEKSPTKQNKLKRLITQRKLLNSILNRDAYLYND